jgi:Rieske Fe-S protein
MPEHDDDLTPPAATGRRTVLRGALVLGAAGVLSACGGSSDNNAAQTPTDTGATPPPESTPTPTAKAKKTAKPKASATPTSKTTASAKPKATKTAAPKGVELGPSSGVPVGGGTIYEKEKIVVTQPKAGEFLAFSAICTHQECILADCDGGKINCGCHNSSFDLTTGVPEGGPATVPLPKMKVSIAGGKVYKV